MTEQASKKLNQHISPPLGPPVPERTGDGGTDAGIVFYGLPYCDATKLAMQWFNDHNLGFVLHDYKTQGITKEALQNWCKQKDWQVLLNKRSTTWRSLNATTQESVINEDTAIDLMVKNTSLIKRPVIVKDGVVVAVGVDKKAFEEVLKG